MHKKLPSFVGLVILCSFAVGWEECEPRPLVTTGQLDDLFEGRAQLVEDTSFVPFPVDGHAETATIAFGGEYKMYFRTFFYLSNGNVVSNGNATGIGLMTSQDGDHWAYHDRGLPLPGLANNPDTGRPWIISPAIIEENGRLTMLYNYADPLTIAFTTSSDGIHWGPSTHILFAGGGEQIGTPDLVKANGQYYVFFHSFRIINGAQIIRRELATGPSLTQLTRHGPILAEARGTWLNTGPGLGDIVYENGYWYQIIEGFGGSTALCTPEGGTELGLSLARSRDLVSWEWSPAGPFQSSRVVGPCGETDMPAWQLIGGRAPTVVTPDLFNPSTGRYQVKRWRISMTPSGRSNSPIVGVAARADGQGYWEAASDGGVFAYGSAPFRGSMAGQPLNAGISGIAATPDGNGYWLVAYDGGVFAFGSARADLGSMSGKPLNGLVMGIASTPSGQGYWLVGSDGGVFAFGDAPAAGSMSGHPLNGPVVGIASTPSGRGYWLAGSDGGIFAFGDAVPQGGLSGSHLNAPIVGITARKDAQGYWLVGGDGGVFAFGAPNFGTTAGYVPQPHMRIVGMSGPVKNGSGYYLVATDGGVIDFGSAIFQGNVHGPGWNL